MGICNCFMFCCMLLYVHSSIAIILMGTRELVALLNLSSWCLVMVGWLFLAVPWGCLWFVIVVFPDHTRLLFLAQIHKKTRPIYLFYNEVQTTRAKIICAWACMLLSVWLYISMFNVHAWFYKSGYLFTRTHAFYRSFYQCLFMYLCICIHCLYVSISLSSVNANICFCLSVWTRVFMFLSICLSENSHVCFY